MLFQLNCKNSIIITVLNIYPSGHLVFDNDFAHIKADSHPLAIDPGGKIRFEYPVHNFFRNGSPVIGDFHQDIIGPTGNFNLDISGFDGTGVFLLSFEYRIFSIINDVDEYLLEFVWVTENVIRFSIIHLQ